MAGTLGIPASRLGSSHIPASHVPANHLGKIRKNLFSDLFSKAECIVELKKNLRGCDPETPLLIFLNL